MTEAVTDLARGTLCPALKAIFQHGLKKPSILGGPCHPWLFIEEVGELFPNFLIVPYCTQLFEFTAGLNRSMSSGFLSGCQQRGREGLQLCLLQTGAV